MSMLSYESSFDFLVLGVDEAGRGPLMGPVVAAVVKYSENIPNTVNDSKKLTPKKREELYNKIISTCEFGVGEAQPDEIDSINILKATELAMQRAYNSFTEKYGDIELSNYTILVDGDKALKVSEKNKSVPIIKGDSKSLCIAAASIIAKVHRDKLVDKIHEQYPQYQFDKHKGYPTPVHKTLIKKYGPIKGVHRYSFEPIKSMVVQSSIKL